MSTATLKPWWTFPRIDRFGTIDPQGNFWKPDSNIQLPGNYPITALLPGTVTDIHNDPGQTQTVVTVKLDNPLNSLATHTFYQHLSSSSVQVGQHLSTGDLLGYNNPSGKVPLGFGFYSGDVYGQGTAWNTLQNDLKPGGAGLLNPTQLLDFAKGQGNNINVTTTGPEAGFSIPNPVNAIDSGIVSAFFNALGLPSAQQVQNTFEQIAIGFFALLLILVGILVVFFANPSTRQVAADGAMAAA